MLGDIAVTVLHHTPVMKDQARVLIVDAARFRHNAMLSKEQPRIQHIRERIVEAVELRRRTIRFRVCLFAPVSLHQLRQEFVQVAQDGAAFSDCG